MSSVVLFIVVTSLCTSSMSAFALAMQRFRWELKKQGRPFHYPPNALRVAAWGLLIVCLVFVCYAQGLGMGPVLFFGSLSLSAVFVLTVANNRPHWLTVIFVFALIGPIGLGIWSV